MKTVIIIGEHHDFPTAKVFIAKNSQLLTASHFRFLLMEGVLPESIPGLVKSPFDRNNCWEAYQALYKSCKTNGMEMSASESVAARKLMEDNPRLHPAFFNTQREKIFVDDIIARQGNCVFLTGAAHAAKICLELKKKGINVFVVQTCPLNPDALIKFSSEISPENLLYTSADLDIKHGLPNMLIQKSTDIAASIQAEMKLDKHKGFPEKRRFLEAFYSSSEVFSDLNHKEFQQSASLLEYLIGSLHDREGSIPEAIAFTQKALDRRVKHQLGADTIASCQIKIQTLKEKLPSFPSASSTF